MAIVRKCTDTRGLAVLVALCMAVAMLVLSTPSLAGPGARPKGVKPISATKSARPPSTRSAGRRGASRRAAPTTSNGFLAPPPAGTSGPPASRPRSRAGNQPPPRQPNITPVVNATTVAAATWRPRSVRFTETTALPGGGTMTRVTGPGGPAPYRVGSRTNQLREVVAQRGLQNQGTGRTMRAESGGVVTAAQLRSRLEASSRSSGQDQLSQGSRTDG